MRDQISLERIKELNPYANVQHTFQSFIEECENTHDITLRIMEPVFRSFNAQANLYAQGRTKPGRIVTYAPPGKSWHNWGLAVDLCDLENGKVNWGFDMGKLQSIATKYGMIWGGTFSKGKTDPPHFELHLGHDIKYYLGLYNEGKVDANGYVIIQ